MQRRPSRALAGRIILSGGLLAAAVLPGCAGSSPARSPDDDAAKTEVASDEPPVAEGGATTPANATGELADTGEPSAPPARTAGGAIDLDADDGLDADIAELSASTGGAAKPAPATAPSSGAREIVYRVTPKGLVIELDGVHLRPEAKPFKEKNGAYGIELVLHAESFDGRQYWLNKPDEGPLSIAGKIESKDGKSARFSDERSGEGEEVITDGAARSFRQRWPGRGQPKLWWGQTVTLEIGLWGVRTEADRERPVRRLFVVKMVAGNKPVAVITPPTIDWGG
jgi:hypothetical protein